MKHRIFTIFASLTIAAMLVVLLGPITVFAAPPPPDYVPVDAGPRIREMGSSPDLIEGSLVEAQADAGVTSTPLTNCTLETKYFLILNDYTGRYQVTTFNLVADGSLAQIWVQTNLAWPAGDPRSTPVVYCEQAQYLLGQFENKIYPTEIDFFGMPNAHDGSNAVLPSLLGLPSDYYYDEAGRQIVLVSNVRDDNYYDPTYPSYIAGFYSPTFELYFDRNVMSIDAYDWANRIGPDGTRPYLYEGVFAHEYQHLLHDDYDSDEENFINEGMSDFAELLTGYGIAIEGHYNFAASHPENSLVVWEDQGGLEILADYGHAYLFQLYLLEQYGQSFIQNLFHNPENGISGVNSSLFSVGSERDFADLYHDMSVAALIDSKKAGGRYEFKSEFFKKFDIGTPDAPNLQAFDFPGVGPYGTDYIWITGNPKDIAKLEFNGVEYSMFPTKWTSVDGWLHSSDGDLLDNWAIFETVGGGTLTFDTWYSIEEWWDFGFVQVSTDGGYTWTSLENAFTTYDYDPNAHPKVIENLPGLTGYQDDPITMSYDLSAYAGQNILVAFRYVTDWATHEGGWFVDNVYVDDTLISDGTDASVFKDITQILPVNNDFTVTFVGIKQNTKGNEYKVLRMNLSDVTEDGLFELSAILKASTQAVMLVTFDAPEGFTDYVGYDYEFIYKTGGPAK